jgi:hypothetical protein
MVVLDVVVLIQQKVIVLIVIDILSVARTDNVLDRRPPLDSRRTINKVTWGFVFGAEADIACGGGGGANSSVKIGQPSQPRGMQK